LRGRVRDEINKSGQKIHPADVDAVIERFPATLDVCTFAYADPLHGEDVGVAVVLQPAADDVLKRLQQWTSERLAAHQMPKRWYLLEHIPRNPRGKVSRSAVGDLCKEGQFRSFVRANPGRTD
jgi:long-chain acyl-CoA synthetase